MDPNPDPQIRIGIRSEIVNLTQDPESGLTPLEQGKFKICSAIFELLLNRRERSQSTFLTI
jgi:hypothetical protein